MATLPSITGFSFERLRTFCLVVESGSIVAAAKGEATRQSQFSRQIGELEDFLGTPLFTRSGKTQQLTEAGRQLALLAEGFFGALGDLASAGKGKAEKVSVAAGESVLRWMVVPRLAEIAGPEQKILPDLRTYPTEKAVRSVLEGATDLAVVRDDAAPERLSKLDAGTMDYSLVVARSLLPGKSAEGLRLAKRLPFAMLSGEGQLVREVQRLIGTLEVTTPVVAFVENFSLLIELLQTQPLCAVIPEPATKELSKERFAVVPVPGIERLKRKLAVIFDPRLAQMRECVRRAAQRISKALATGNGHFSGAGTR